ncbi:signal peptidase I [Nocardioides antri]|uniref:Signal peptidase I n=1 Tax=Nocardioides antri TaxID=2607659 RepID=A0A5B1LVN3_9ACTN|nr:signal peptidase I [Nocardioides antri]
MARARRVLLTVGAVIGALCLVVAVAGPLFGAKTLVVRSGSMAPAMPTGSLAVSWPVDAADVAVGDVVSVVDADGSRVTHRVVGVQPAEGDGAALTLQGDANPTPDAEVYEVTEADRVLVSVPWAGRVVAFLGTTWGLLALGALTAGLLGYAFRPTRTPRDPGGRGGAAQGGTPGRRASEDDGPERDRRAPHDARGLLLRALGAAPLVAALVVAHGAAGTSAAFADTAALTTGAVAGYSVVSPVAIAAPGNCTASNSALGSSMTLRWTGISPAAQPRPQLANYEYQLRFLDRNNANAVLNTIVVAHSGLAGSQQTYQLTSGTIGNLLGLNLFASNRVTTEIRSRLKTTTWTGSTVVSTNWTLSTVLGIATFTCNQ